MNTGHRILAIIGSLLSPFVFVFAAGFIAERIFRYYDSANAVLTVFIILCVLALGHTAWQIVKIVKPGGK